MVLMIDISIPVVCMVSIDDSLFRSKIELFCHLGHGAYFADDPSKSHQYTTPDANNGTRVMYYTKVLLGKASILNETNPALVSAPKDFHSVIGKHSSMTEYMIYRYGQALPYLKIIYKV